MTTIYISEGQPFMCGSCVADLGLQASAEPFTVSDPQFTCRVCDLTVEGEW